jgi:dihydrofolate reductase
MRKIINSTYITLDGVIENPHLWPSPASDDERTGTIQTELLLSCDAVLMGRRTYEGFAPAWSARSGDPMSDRMNSVRKYVVSSELRDPEWNNTTVITHDPVSAINQLKEQPGTDIVQYGFGQLSYTLMEHGLLDELRLWIHPVFVGKGGPADLLYRDCPVSRFDLVDTTSLKSGIVVLRYAAKAS